MNIISLRIFLIFLLAIGAPLTASAQDFELGAFYGAQSYKESSRIKPENKAVMGLRLGYSAFDFGPALLQLTGGYQPESSTKIANSTSNMKQSHTSAGVMFNFKLGFALGAGIEYRSEKISVGSDSATYNRPWARANIGYAIPSPLLKPFIGLEYSYPLMNKSDAGTDTASNLKAAAPKSQFGIYGGIRF